MGVGEGVEVRFSVERLSADPSLFSIFDRNEPWPNLGLFRPSLESFLKAGDKSWQLSEKTFHGEISKFHIQLLRVNKFKPFSRRLSLLSSILRFNNYLFMNLQSLPYQAATVVRWVSDAPTPHTSRAVSRTFAGQTRVEAQISVLQLLANKWIFSPEVLIPYLFQINLPTMHVET